jgi:hypothetical protein
MRVGIFKSDDAPNLTLLLKEGFPLPVSVAGEKWQQVKVVTYGEVRADLLAEIRGNGYFFGEMGADSTAPIGIHGGLSIIGALVQASLRFLLNR